MRREQLEQNREWHPPQPVTTRSGSV